jgi:hypothetical protein
VHGTSPNGYKMYLHSKNQISGKAKIFNSDGKEGRICGYL